MCIVGIKEKRERKEDKRTWYILQKREREREPGRESNRTAMLCNTLYGSKGMFALCYVCEAVILLIFVLRDVIKSDKKLYNM